MRSLGRAVRAPLASLMLLAPAFALGQAVPYVANGLVSITGGPAIYNGRYVIKQSDFGFFWLDTVTLSPGHVQAESKCTGFQPTSDTDIYVIGDCNGITSISSSGSYVLVRQLNGQCGAATIGCLGPRSDGHSRFTFALGSFDYLGDLGEIADSTQATDPQGRTWTIQPRDASGMNFLWTASGGNATAPPVAAAFAVNLSAGGRNDKTNYYGDKWQLQDTSNPAASSVTWDFNYAGSFSADESGTESSDGTVVGYFPCDPATGGNFRTGANCRQSLGLPNPPPATSYQFALRSSNSYGPSANTFTSGGIGIACPQAIIAGYAGFSGTCSKTGGTLVVSSGGFADASGSSGNLAEALFSWTFSFPSGSPTSAQGAFVTVPVGASAFTLSISFPGGYQASASGAVAFPPSFVAEFSMPASAVRGSAVNLTNQMQKPATTTLNSVDYLIAPGPCGAPPFVPTNPLATFFLALGGSAPVTAPNSTGTYCVSLKFNFTPQGSPPSSEIASHSLTLRDWSPLPAIGVYLDSGRTQPAPFAGSSFYLTTATTYYLFDLESPPPPGVSYPGAAWSLTSTSGEVSLGSTAAQTPLPTKFTAACSSNCTLKLLVGGATAQIPVNIQVGACVPDATTLCLNSARFRVQVTWGTADGRSGAGQAVGLTGDTGSSVRATSR